MIAKLQLKQTGKVWTLLLVAIGLLGLGAWLLLTTSRAGDSAQDQWPAGSFNGAQQTRINTAVDSGPEQFFVDTDLPRLVFGVDSGAAGVAVRLFHNQFEAAVSAAPGRGITPRNLLEQQAQLTVVLGSGFVVEPGSLQPVGLLRQAGVTLNTLEPMGYTRILGSQAGALSVVHRSDYQDNVFDDALQLGPGIIENGQLDISERDLQRKKYHRSFIALCGDSWLAGVTTEPTNLRTLGIAILDLSAREQLDCVEVINLAGHRQGVLLTQNAQGQSNYFGDIDSPRASLLTFSRR